MIKYQIKILNEYCASFKKEVDVKWDDIQACDPDGDQIICDCCQHIDYCPRMLINISLPEACKKCNCLSGKHCVIGGCINVQ